jgi:cytochrome b subunit of formate dehydrogenase
VRTYIDSIRRPIRLPRSLSQIVAMNSGLEHVPVSNRNLLATPFFWGAIAFFVLLAVAGSLVVIGAGPSVVGRVIAVIVAFLIVAIGAVLAIAIAGPDVIRGVASNDD